MSIKVHFLHRHLDRFSDNLDELSEGQKKKFHKRDRRKLSRQMGRAYVLNYSNFDNVCWLNLHSDLYIFIS